ncbi:hypothetical protein CAQUA_00010 [Corynebacterium aquatimens]|uniref:Uncharacterized protein n=1 Tax=Corynebacterium aquatimens TaxID=1190508 RepID=A0A931E337_9CORY|nr:hypothetical protein [Corynebacterium aquatimens]WJY64760.1 hypothetical protein CAQUA_00010 [Corynebacterium aquatimens]
MHVIFFATHMRAKPNPSAPPVEKYVKHVIYRWRNSPIMWSTHAGEKFSTTTPRSPQEFHTSYPHPKYRVHLHVTPAIHTTHKTYCYYHFFSL